MRVIALLLGVTLAAHAADEENDRIKIEFQKETELADFLDLMSRTTGRPLLYDPMGQRIRNQKMGAQITIEVPKTKAFDAFRAILAFYELILVPVGPRGYETHLVVDSRSTNNFVKNKALFVEDREIAQFADRDGLYISSFIPVEHVENLTTLRTALSTMVSPAGICRVHEDSGVGVLVMDYAPVVSAMQRLISAMDVPSDQAQVLESIELSYAHAKEGAESGQALFREHQPPMLIAWGKNDKIFPAAGAEPYKRDLKTLEFHLLDAGHFALETNGDEIAQLMRDFLGKHVGQQ